MNTIEATRLAESMHGLGKLITQPAESVQIYHRDTGELEVITEPIDELSCDECGRWVAWVTDGEGGGEFVYYGISKPSQVVLIHCEDCYG